AGGTSQLPPEGVGTRGLHLLVVLDGRDQGTLDLVVVRIQVPQRLLVGVVAARRAVGTLLRHRGADRVGPQLRLGVQRRGRAEQLFHLVLAGANLAEYRPGGIRIDADLAFSGSP